MAVASGALFRVPSAGAIGEHAYPCCRIGGECCPDPLPARAHCCGWTSVSRWLERQGKLWAAAHPAERKGRDPRLFARQGYLEARPDGRRNVSLWAPLSRAWP